MNAKRNRPIGSQKFSIIRVNSWFPNRFGDSWFTFRTGLANKSEPDNIPPMHATEIPNFEKLTDLQRVALAEEILGSLRAPEALPLPVAHGLELDRRWNAYMQNPTNVLTKEQFRQATSIRGT